MGSFINDFNCAQEGFWLLAAPTPFSAQVSPAQLSSAPISSGELSSAQLSAVQLSSAQLTSAQLSSAQSSLIFRIFHRPQNATIYQFQLRSDRFLGFGSPHPILALLWAQLRSTPRDQSAILPKNQREFLRTSIRESLRS